MSHVSAHSPLYRELSLPEMLADPIVRAVMARDGVAKRDLESVIGAVRDRMARRQMERHKNDCRESGPVVFEG